MPGRHKRRREMGWDYSPLFRRIEEAFAPEEVTDRAIKDYINARTPEMDALAEQLARTSELSLEIEEVDEISELRELKKEVNNLEVHRGFLLERIEEMIIALSIATVEEFARERRIVLTEKIKGAIETWKDGKQYMVIRKNGSFKAWRRI